MKKTFPYFLFAAIIFCSMALGACGQDTPAPSGDDDAAALDNTENQSAYINDNSQDLQPDRNELASQLYDAKVEYLGSDPDTGNLLNLLFRDSFGLYTFELATDSEPYGLTIDFGSGLPDEEQMNKYACVILALIDNLDQVSWRSGIHTGGSMDTAAAADYIYEEGGNIKDYAASADKIASLLEKLVL